MLVMLDGEIFLRLILHFSVFVNSVFRELEQPLYRDALRMQPFVPVVFLLFSAPLAPVLFFFHFPAAPPFEPYSSLFPLIARLLLFDVGTIELLSTPTPRLFQTWR